MISKLEIENFRSIHKDKVSLEQITVLIGANGSGKSNLVKAIEFLSDIPKLGIHVAVNHQGGRDALVPKAISLKNIKKAKTRFKYITKVLSPISLAQDSKSYFIDVLHDFSFSFPSRQRLKIIKEKLVFNKALMIGEVLRDEHMSPKISKDNPAHPRFNSTVTIAFDGENESVKLHPEISDKTIINYLHWFGLGEIEEKIATPEEFNKFMKSYSEVLKKGFKRKRNQIKGLLVDPDMPSVLKHSTNFHIFRSTNKTIERYDFLLNELRKEQTPSEKTTLSKAGKNMPATLRKLSSNKTAFRRLKESFETIAPHISGMKSSTLRTGKEFIEFIEAKSGRGIESWESSDGSLRALAILLAIEAMEFGDTIIIEEPEQNLHPWAVKSLMEHIRTVVNENALQVILTTHSEHVLNCVEPNEVRVVTRTHEKGTKFFKIEEVISKDNIQMGEVGRLWVKGLLGGVPTT